MPLFQVLLKNRDALGARNGGCGGVEYWNTVQLISAVKKDATLVAGGQLTRHNPSVVNTRVGVSLVRARIYLCIHYCLKLVALMSADRPWWSRRVTAFPGALVRDGSPLVHYCTACFTLPRLRTDTPPPGVCHTHHPLSCSRRPIPLLQPTPATEPSPLRDPTFLPLAGK